MNEYTRRPQSDEPEDAGSYPEDAGSYPPLYNLVYCSRAAPNVDEAAVANMVDAARRNNPSHGITGLLVFGSGIFFQWLEGPRDNITHLMHILLKDPRHESVVTLSESEEERERLFPEWDMELVSTEDIQDVLEDALSQVENAKSEAALRQLLERVTAS